VIPRLSYVLEDRKMFSRAQGTMPFRLCQDLVGAPGSPLAIAV